MARGGRGSGSYRGSGRTRDGGTGSGTGSLRVIMRGVFIPKCVILKRSATSAARSTLCQGAGLKLKLPS